MESEKWEMESVILTMNSIPICAMDFLLCTSIEVDFMILVTYVYPRGQYAISITPLQTQDKIKTTQVSNEKSEHNPIPKCLNPSHCELLCVFNTKISSLTVLGAL
jgi:hypothetical protein